MPDAMPLTRVRAALRGISGLSGITLPLRLVRPKRRGRLPEWQASRMSWPCFRRKQTVDVSGRAGAVGVAKAGQLCHSWPRSFFLPCVCAFHGIQQAGLLLEEGGSFLQIGKRGGFLWGAFGGLWQLYWWRLPCQPGRVICSMLTLWRQVLLLVTMGIVAFLPHDVGTFVFFCRYKVPYLTLPYY